MGPRRVAGCGREALRKSLSTIVRSVLGMRIGCGGVIEKILRCLPNWSSGRKKIMNAVLVYCSRSIFTNN